MQTKKWKSARWADFIVKCSFLAAICSSVVPLYADDEQIVASASFSTVRALLVDNFIDKQKSHLVEAGFFYIYLANSSLITFSTTLGLARPRLSPIALPMMDRIAVSLPPL